MVAATQFINIQRGRHEVAIDLSAQQAQSLRNNRRVRVTTQPSTWVFWLFANNNPSDLDGDVEQAVPERGALRARLPVVRAARRARARSRRAGSSRRCSSARCRVGGAAAEPDAGAAALAASGVGGQTFTLEYPSDLTINGVAFATMAQRVQANLQAIGVNVELSGAPVGTWLDKYRGGKMAFGLSLWGPDYPDPADYLAFMPGELVGLRVGWPRAPIRRSSGSPPRARVTTSDAARAPIYRQIQRRLNQSGPYFPLIQPMQVFAATSDLAGRGVQPALPDRRPRPRRPAERQPAPPRAAPHVLTIRSGGKPFSLRPPPGSQTTTSSIRTPKRPSTRIDGSSVNVMPTSSGVSSSVGDERPLVDVHADPVAHAVPEVRPVAALLDRLAAGAVHLARGTPGAPRPASCAASTSS